MLKGQNTYNERKLIDFIPYLIAQDEVFAYITEREVPGVKPYYMISNYGRVFMRYNQNPFMLLSVDPKGYWVVVLQTIYGPKMLRVHRLVKLVFDYIEGCENLVVDHKDGNRLNPYLGNLEWTTFDENVRLGFERYQNDKISPSDLQKVPEYMAKDIKRNRELKKQNIEKTKQQEDQQIKDYKQKNFNDLKNNFNCQSERGKIDIGKTTHPDEQVHEICKMLQEGYTASYIATTLKVKKSYVASVRYGQARPDISCNYDFSNYGTIEYNDKWLFTSEQIHAICSYMTENNIAEAPSKKAYIKRMFAILNIEYTDAKYGCILDIYRGRQYKSITKNYNIRHENPE